MSLRKLWEGEKGRREEEREGGREGGRERRERREGRKRGIKRLRYGEMAVRTEYSK